MPVRDAPTTGIGSLSGSANYLWGLYQEYLETVPDLLWPTSTQTYARMRHDPKLTGLLAQYTTPIVRAQWSIDPRGASGKMVKICADSLGLPVLGRPDDPGPWRRRGVRWAQHLRMAAGLQLVWGHIPFEPLYDVTSGQAMLAGLPERLPPSITGFNVTDAGDLKSIEQASTSSPRGVEIPAERLLFYVREREGAAWQGRSMLRPAFGPWLFKQDMMRVQGTSIRRFGAGTPTMEQIPGTNPSNAQIAKAQAAARAVRVGDTGGVTTPGFTLRIKGVEGTLPDAMPFLNWLNQEMAQACLANVMELGQTAHGSRALGQVFVDVLALALQSFAEEVALTATDLCVRLTDFNEGEAANAPAVVVGDVAASKQVLATAISELVSSGGLLMDPALEKWVREAFSLPARETPYPAAPTVPASGGSPSGPPDAGHPPAPAPVAAAAWPYRRQLSAAEKQAGLDPQALDQAHDSILDGLLAAWPAITATWVASITGQVRAAVAAGTLTGLAQMTLDPGDAVQEITDAMTAAAQAGVDTATAEATGQGVDVGDVTVDTNRIDAMAAAVAAVMTSAMVAAAAREALRLAGPDAAPADVAAGVADFLNAMSGTYPQDVLSGAVSDGINTGRAAVAAAAPPPTVWLASEIRDAATCAACQAVDGHEYSTWAAAQADYPTGGYALCAGRERCRGVLVPVWAQEGQVAAMGGKPSKGTPKDGRLSENKPKPASKPKGGR